jgi:hypothetical protein
VDPSCWRVLSGGLHGGATSEQCRWTESVANVVSPVAMKAGSGGA